MKSAEPGPGGSAAGADRPGYPSTEPVAEATGSAASSAEPAASSAEPAASSAEPAASSAESAAGAAAEDESEAIDTSVAEERAEIVHPGQVHPGQATPASRALASVQAEPGAPKPDPILIAEQVSRRFGGLLAVDVERLEVQRGTITALIGPNGAGKSTFFNLVSGFDKPTSGKWSFNGRDISSMPAYRISRLGMVRTFQLTKALSRMTALENMMLGATQQRGEHFLPAMFWPSWRGQEVQIRERADVLLERFNLAHMRDQFAGTMSGGQRKLLEMARAMMVQPALIMLDEPMAGVNPALTQSLLGHIQALRDEGTTIVLVEHDMDVIMSISDWIVCFAEGTVIAEGRPDDIRSNDAVVDAYLGARRALPRKEGDQ